MDEEITGGPGGDVAPGDPGTEADGHEASTVTYVIGLGLALALTAASFWAAGSHLVWQEGIPAALIALAIAQMGVHLVFFLHLSTGPDNTNNSLALAFGVLIVALVLVGSLFIMSHLNHELMPMSELMKMQR